jgi:hypothetical protein
MNSSYFKQSYTPRAFNKDNTNKIAWSSDESYELKAQGYQRTLDKNIPKPRSVHPKVISIDEIKGNQLKFKNLEKRVMERKMGTLLQTAEKRIPSAIGKGKGLLGKLALGAVGMLNISIMKSLQKQSIGMFERYMKDGAAGKQILNASRIGLAKAGRSRFTHAVLGAGIGLGTVGLANALSRTRHGRSD